MYEEANFDDLNTILLDSIIRWEGKPVYVKEITPDKELYLKSLVKDGVKKTHISDERLDFVPVPLGMCNHGGAAFWVARKPIRQWCQGLKQANLLVSDISASHKDNAFIEVQKLKAKGLYSTIMGEFEPLDKVIRVVLEEENVFSMAFSRCFAIDKEMNLYFKMDKVGMLDPDKLQPIFNSSKKYLQELMYA